MGTRSFLDYNVVQPGHEASGAEPTLRMLIFQYYDKHFCGNEELCNKYASEYCRQLSNYLVQGDLN